MMLSAGNTILCAAAALSLWLCIGLPVALRIFDRNLALPLAPALGWAIHNAVSLPVFMIFGLAPLTAYGVGGAMLAAAIAALAMPLRRGELPSPGRVFLWISLAAAILALVPAMAILPKISAEGVAFAGPIFDHSKIAMIDDMVRLGLPPGNPFFHEGDGPSGLGYYYLWHTGAAQVALMLGVSGWEADAALTWVTAFAAIMLMAGLAVSFAGRASAGLWAVALCAAGSLRPALEFVFGAKAVAEFIWPANGFGSFLFQSAWVPQHIASATCVVLATLLLARMATRPNGVTLAALALVVAAGVQSSTWVGGVTFAIAAALIGLALLLSMAPPLRLRFLAYGAGAALLAACFAFPVLRDQYAVTALREGGSPIAIQHYEVLGELVPEQWRRLLDLPAFWLVQLPVEFPAVAFTGLVALVAALRRKRETQSILTARALCALVGASLITSWLLFSTIGNNDLGWRAVLPGMMALTAFAADGLSRWIATGQFRLAVPALLALLLGLPDGIRLARANVTGELKPSARIFAEAPDMWSAVRRHAGTDERVGNNPLSMWDITPWPVNFSWALFANRRSCFASYELVLAYSSLPRERRLAIDRQFVRVFEGEGTADDIRALATRYNCSVILVTPQDKAWERDPFASSSLYRLVETNPGKWRIYRRTEHPGK
jgi:hypothetical protein